MNTLINKANSAISGAALFAASVAIAGFGFAVIAALAVFALFAIGVTLLAAPFIAIAHQGGAETDAEATA